MNRDIFSALKWDKYGAAIVTVVFYVLLLDAAVGTFMSGAPVRWIVVFTISVYLGVSAVAWRLNHSLWQRIGWRGRALISSFVFLGLLTAAAWRPEGMTLGLALLGMSTSSLLSLVTAAAVAFSGFILLRSRYPHPTIRWTIGAVVAYGVTAFLWAIFDGTLYPQLFHGKSFWSLLPWWLQGAIIGQFVVIPAALLVLAKEGLQRIRLAQVKIWGTKTLVLLLCFNLAFAGFMTPNTAGVSAPQMTQSLNQSMQELLAAMAGVPEGTQLSAEQVVNRLEKQFDMLKEAEREIPRDTFDVQAIVDEVGSDPEKLFAWVRDETFLVPYRGVLREAKGVLMDRLGNSLDRALLLLALLQQAGHNKIKIAHATLSDEEVSKIQRRARRIPKSGASVGTKYSSEAVEDFLGKHAQEFGLNKADFLDRMAQVDTERQRLVKEVHKRVALQASLIAKAVGKPDKEAHKIAEASRRVALRDHWWVQLQNGSKWVDLDPTLPNAEPGKPLTSAQEEFAGDKINDRLSQEAHTLQVRMVIECWEKGRLVEVPVLTQELLPFFHIGERIAVHHSPMNWPPDLDLFASKDPLNALKSAVLAQREWISVLSVGEARVSKFSFTDSCLMNQPDLPGYVQSVLAGRALVSGLETGVEKLGRGIFGIISTGRIGDTGTARRVPDETNSNLQISRPSGKAQVTAEWIEYEIRVPGEKPRKIRRQIFDLVGPATRAAWKGKQNMPTPKITDAQRMERGWALLGQTEVLPLVGQLSPEFIEYLMTKNLLANREVLLGLFRDVDSADPKALTDQASKLKPLSGHLYTLALVRRAWSRFRGDVYLDRLNILSYHTQLQQNSQGELRLLQGFDIVANDVGIRSGSGADPFLVRLEQGVLDTNAEALLAALSSGSMENTVGRGQVENTAELFTASTEQGIKWMTVRNVHDPTWKKVKLVKDVRAQIEQDLVAGYVVLAPEKGVSLEGRVLVGWWRVNGSTGQTLGIGEYGWGQVTTESLTMLDVSIKQVDITMTYVACLIRAAAGGVEGDVGLQMANMQCLAETYRQHSGGYAMGLGRGKVLGSLGSQIYDLLSGAIGLVEQADSR